MNFGNTTDWLVIVVAQVGPTELFLPENQQEIAGSSGILIWIIALVAIILIGVWIRAMGQRRLDPCELAFQTLTRRMKLSRSQITALREMGQTNGQTPIGLLMSPSAIRSAGIES